MALLTLQATTDESAAPRVDRRAARRSATKEEIVAAAWGLVREHGLAGLVMRDLGERVGMKAQSLYSYFGSKHEIYDAMFYEGYQVFAAVIHVLPDTTDNEVGEPGAEFVYLGAHRFFDFCTSDPVRYQLMFQRTIPDFVPSDESYALAVSVYETTVARMAAIGIDDPAAVDLWTALLTGLADQQISNDAGGDRWRRIIDRAIDMFLAANASHLVKPNERRKQS